MNIAVPLTRGITTTFYPAEHLKVGSRTTAMVKKYNLIHHN
jgi:hypothetical protein